MTTETLFKTKRNYKRWTDEMLAAEARKYETKQEFRNNSANAYDSAKKRKLLDEFCNHMIPAYISWTFEVLRETASNFETRNEFKKGAYSAYQQTLRRGFIDEVCSHMNPGDHTSDENMVYIWQVGSLPIYKVGVSSWKYGSRRMDHVADQLGFTPNLIQLHKTKKGEARDIEDQLLEIGNPLTWNWSFNGHTEFRRWTPSHLKEALNLLCQQE